MEWKIPQILISVTRTARWTQGDDWDWKTRFASLKSTVKASDPWRMLLDVAEGEADAIHALCDGRFQVETTYEPIKEDDPQLASETASETSSMGA